MYLLNVPHCCSFLAAATTVAAATVAAAYASVCTSEQARSDTGTSWYTQNTALSVSTMLKMERIQCT
jgi:hypothetical protein